MEISMFKNKSSKAQKPRIIPEISEWRAAGGFFEADSIKRIVGENEKLSSLMQMFASEFEAVTGKNLEIHGGSEAQNGDIYFELTDDEDLGAEGYIIQIGGAIRLAAASETGLLWATRTLLQMLKQNYLPCGEIRDCPQYKIRGFMLDVGRKPVSMRMLREIVKTMSWYKMNDLQIHLNDNYIWLEDYVKNGELDALEAYDAFRLESGLVNEKGETPTAKDYAYSKAEFREFIRESRKYGVNIVPEIDVPAHALSFTKAFPEHMVRGKVSPLCKKRPLLDHLDISKPETMDFIKRIFDDYTKGENPVFDKDTVVHIGADEFLADYGAYRRFFNELAPYVKQTNTVRAWGGFTWIKDKPETEVAREAIEGAELNLWSADWADGKEMHKKGFKLINTIDCYLYIVPNGNGKRGSYADYLDKKLIFKKFSPSKIRMKNRRFKRLHKNDPQMLGAAFALWNDNIDKRANGLSEEDIFDRFYDSAALIAEKTWAPSGKEKGSAKRIDEIRDAVGSAPCSAPLFAAESDCILAETNFTASKNADISANSVTLGGGKSFAETALTRLGNGDSLIFKAHFNSVIPETILFECDAPYGTHDIRITGSGKLGFTRENYEYEFDYSPKAGEETEFIIEASPLKTTLRVNGGEKIKAVGAFIHGGTVRRSGIECSSFSIPVRRVGSKTNAAEVTLRDIQIRKNRK